jgi:hypothetical protein
LGLGNLPSLQHVDVHLEFKALAMRRWKNWRLH